LEFSGGVNRGHVGMIGECGFHTSEAIRRRVTYTLTVWLTGNKTMS